MYRERDVYIFMYLYIYIIYTYYSSRLGYVET